MTKKETLVDVYKNTRKPRYPDKYYESIRNELKLAKPAGFISGFYRGEVKPILDGRVSIVDVRLKKSPLSNILFEYLVIKTMT